MSANSCKQATHCTSIYVGDRNFSARQISRQTIARIHTITDFKGSNYGSQVQIIRENTVLVANVKNFYFEKFNINEEYTEETAMKSNFSR